jgi:hypothetical protein
MVRIRTVIFGVLYFESCVVITSETEHTH